MLIANPLSLNSLQAFKPLDDFAFPCNFVGGLVRPRGIASGENHRAVKKLVKLRQRKSQQLFRRNLYFAPYGKEQACYAAGLGTFFEEEAEASGIALACAARIACASPMIAARIAGILSVGIAAQNSSALGASSARAV